MDTDGKAPSLKFVTFIFGMGLLFLGANMNIAPDWDYGVSILMGICTYFTATKTVTILITLNWRKWYYVVFTTWFSIDGIYVIYWYFVDREVLLHMRDIQWPVSLCLYLACGLIWAINNPKPLADSSKS